MFSTAHFEKQKLYFIKFLISLLKNIISFKYRTYNNINNRNLCGNIIIVILMNAVINGMKALQYHQPTVVVVY